MQIVRQHPSRLTLFPVDGNTTDINEGAVVMPGVTDENNRSVLIVASSAAADAVGLLGSLHDSSATTDSDPDAGTVYTKIGVAMFEPGCEVAAEMSQASADLVDVASATSTVITITSLEDDIDGSWFYVVSGTGIGQLEYVKASASGNFTAKSAMTTTLDSTSKVIILRRLFHQTVELNTAADKIKSTAAAGNLPWRVLGHEFRYDGLEQWTPLDPTKHAGLELNGLNAKFRLILSPADTLKNPLD